MSPKFMIIPNSGAGDCYYLSVIDSINNKHLTKKFLHFMGKKYTKKGKLTVQILRDFIADHSDQFTYYTVSSLLNIPDDHKCKQHFPQEDVETLIKSRVDGLKDNLVTQFGTKLAAHVNKHILSDKTTDNETKRTNFVKDYKKMIKKQYTWVCFFEVNIFELLYTKFVKSEFNEKGYVVFVDANDDYIRKTPKLNFEKDHNLYLNYKKCHYEAWVFNNKPNKTLKKIRLKHNNITHKLNNKIKTITKTLKKYILI